MDVFARDRSLGMTDQCGNRNLGETQIVRNARETVPEHVRRDVPEPLTPIQYSVSAVATGDLDTSSAQVVDRIDADILDDSKRNIAAPT